MNTPKITGFQSLAQTFTIEFERKAYYRIEIFLLETGEAIRPTHYFAEVYMLCWPHGQIAMPAKGQRLDTRFRQSWLFLDDFPLISDSVYDEVRKGVIGQLAKYTAVYLGEYETGLKRGQPVP